MSKGLRVRIFTNRIILALEDEFHEVELFYEGKKLKKDFGYIKESLVYIYRGKLDKVKKRDMLPGIYQNADGEYVFNEPSKNEAEKYSIDNLIELDLDRIFKDVENHEEDFRHPEDIEIINNNAEVYVPTIKEEDDFLKYIIKTAIQLKKINLKNYKDKFTNQYGLANMKSSLNKDTKMTVTNFDRWCEILGLKWKMEVVDDGLDKMNPLPDGIYIESEQF